MLHHLLFQNSFRTEASTQVSKFGFLLMTLIASAGFGLFPMIAACASVKSGGEGDEIYAVYSRGGGMDIYDSGDRYGYKLEIYIDGHFRLYRRVYLEDEDDGGAGRIRDQNVREGELDPDRLDSLRSLIDESDFFSFPSRLPDVSPHEAEYRTPAENVIISIRKDDGTMYRVQSNMGVDLRHYPQDFLEIHRFLRAWQRELIVE